jgi:hypothetical protein
MYEIREELSENEITTLSTIIFRLLKSDVVSSQYVVRFTNLPRTITIVKKRNEYHIIFHYDDRTMEIVLDENFKTINVLIDYHDI